MAAQPHSSDLLLCSCPASRDNISDFPELKGILPGEYKYTVCNWIKVDPNRFESRFRVNAKTEKEAIHWINEFEASSNTVYLDDIEFPNFKEGYIAAMKCGHTTTERSKISAVTWACQNLNISADESKDPAAEEVKSADKSKAPDAKEVKSADGSKGPVSEKIESTDESIHSTTKEVESTGDSKYRVLRKASCPTRLVVILKRPGFSIYEIPDVHFDEFPMSVIYHQWHNHPIADRDESSPLPRVVGRKIYMPPHALKIADELTEILHTGRIRQEEFGFMYPCAQDETHVHSLDPESFYELISSIYPKSEKNNPSTESGFLLHPDACHVDYLDPESLGDDLLSFSIKKSLVENIQPKDDAFYRCINSLASSNSFDLVSRFLNDEFAEESNQLSEDGFAHPAGASHPGTSSLSSTSNPSYKFSLNDFFDDPVMMCNSTFDFKSKIIGEFSTVQSDQLSEKKLNPEEG